MTRRFARTRAYAPDPAAPGRICESPGCEVAGEYRAPRSRMALNDYIWMCLPHVRAYNASWDFYKGMSPGQIEAQLRADTSWQRPTWPLGHNGSTAAVEEAILRDPLHLLATGRGAPSRRPVNETPSELREPLAALGLDWPLTLEVLRSRYKELAKRHHPDANGGDRGAEERLKTINLAYATIRGRLATQPKMAAAG